jgi:translation initiation factor 2 alpha subunit (eIF-2alpha)
MQKVFDIFKELLAEIHIPTKTTDTQFHKDSEEAYELAFDIFHLVSEMNQDIEKDPSVDEDEV